LIEWKDVSHLLKGKEVSKLKSAYVLYTKAQKRKADEESSSFNVMFTTQNYSEASSPK